MNIGYELRQRYNDIPDEVLHETSGVMFAVVIPEVKEKRETTMQNVEMCKQKKHCLNVCVDIDFSVLNHLSLAKDL